MRKKTKKFRRLVVVVVEMELDERLTINEAALGGGDYITFLTPAIAPGSAESDDVPRLRALLFSCFLRHSILVTNL